MRKKSKLRKKATVHQDSVTGCGTNYIFVVIYLHSFIKEKILNKTHSSETSISTCVLVAQSCQTLCDCMDCSPPGSSVCGISQARILEWVAILSSRGSSWPQGLNPDLLHWRQILYHWATWQAPREDLQMVNKQWKDAKHQKPLGKNKSKSQCYTASHLLGLL